MRALLLVLLGALLLWQVGRVRNHYRAARLALEPQQDHPNTSTDEAADARREPAYRFPGVPAGWSLDAYARDGIKQMQIMLVQQARRRGEN